MLRQLERMAVRVSRHMPARRLTYRDYSTVGLYFVTICANFKHCVFGRVKDTRVQLSALGQIAQESWLCIPSHFNRVNLHAFVVMPNHVHGIIEISAAELAQHAAPLQGKATASLRHGGSGSLSAIVRSYKAEVSRRAGLELGWKGEVWQHGYFDRVIRDGREFSSATRYILENPTKWQLEEERLHVRSGT